MPRKQPPAAIAQQVAADLASGSALGSAAGLRQRLLDLAGVSDSEQALLTRLVINKFRDLMSAQTVTRLVVAQGRDIPAQVEEFIDDDGALQARAAAELVDLLGLKPSRSAGSLTGGGPMTVNVSFAPAPAPIEVIELPRN